MYKLRQLTHKLNKVLWFFFRKRYVCINSGSSLDLIQSLVPKHYVCYGYLFLICAFKYLEVMEICETKLLL
jgi:hypothetical protein